MSKKFNSGEKFFFFAICFIGVFSITAIFIDNLVNDKVYEQANNYAQELRSNAWYSQTKDSTFRDVVLKEKLKNCMDYFQYIYKSDYDIETTGNSYWHPSLDKTKVEKLFQTAEANCSQDIIQTVALSNQDAGSALTYYLMQKNVAVPERYKKFAKQDDVALASISLN
jgi:hypothetical protein